MDMNPVNHGISIFFVHATGNKFREGRGRTFGNESITIDVDDFSCTSAFTVWTAQWSHFWRSEYTAITTVFSRLVRGKHRQKKPPLSGTHSDG